MRLRYLGTAAAEGCPALFCTCPLCTSARQGGGRDVRTRSQALVDDTLLIDFPADTYHHALSTPELNLPALRHLLITHSMPTIFIRWIWGCGAPASPRRHRGC